MRNNVNNISSVNEQEYSQYFVGLTKKYLADTNSDLQFQKELDLFIKYAKRFGQGNNLLEIGCGTGRTLLLISKEGYSCVGIDFDEMQINFANEVKVELKIKNITFLTAKIGDNTIVDKTFDIIISNDLVEHLPENVLIEYFKQVHSLLSENGIFLIHSKPLKYTYLLNKKFILFVLLLCFLPDKLFNNYLKFLDYLVPRIYKIITGRRLLNTWQDLPPGHCNPPDEENIQTQLRRNGFNVEEIITYHPSTHKFSKIFRRIVKSKKLDTSIFIFCKKISIDNTKTLM